MPYPSLTPCWQRFCGPIKKEDWGRATWLELPKCIWAEQSQTFKGSQGLWVGFHGRWCYRPSDMSGVTPPITVSSKTVQRTWRRKGRRMHCKLLIYDPQRIYTDVFYFDGVSKVQKAGDVLMARFKVILLSRGWTCHAVLHHLSSIIDAPSWTI